MLIIARLRIIPVCVGLRNERTVRRMKRIDEMDKFELAGFDEEQEENDATD